MTVFKLPDLGEGLSEAEVLRWHVQVGDRIEVDAPMLAVETAKAVVEVPSPVRGTITALHARPGDRIEIGAPLVEFTLEGTPSERPPDAGTVVGSMPAASEEHPASAAPAAARGAPLPRLQAVPAARALARSLGVELGAIGGSGRGGRVTLEDVLAAAGSDRASRPARPPLQAPADAPAELQEVRSLRRSMAQSMSDSHEQVAACTVFDDADLQRWNSRGDYSARVLRAIAAGVKVERGLNAWYDAAAQSRLLFEHLDVGLAVDTADGLIVPVIRRVEQLSAGQLRSELERLKRAARERTIRSEELRHCTFMLTNFGTLAGRYATPLVVPPAVAILGTGRVRRDVVAADERIELHWRMPLSLSFDHRVITGGEAVRFLGAVIADLERAE